MKLSKSEVSVLDYVLGNVINAMEEDKYMSETRESKQYTDGERVCLVLTESEMEALANAFKKINS